MATDSGILITKEDGNLVLNNEYQNFYFIGCLDYGDGMSENMLQYSNSMTIDSDGSTLIWAWGCSDNNRKAFLFSNAPREASAKGYGMQVFNEAGKVIFDSTWKPMKVIHQYTIPSGAPAEVYRLPEGKECAVVPTGRGQLVNQVFESSSHGVNWYWAGATYAHITVVDKTVKWTTTYVEWNPKVEPLIVNYYTYSIGNPAYMMLDVTNYLKCDVPTVPEHSRTAMRKALGLT